MISDLYNSGIINGETFLFCVENNINTEDEIITFLSSGVEIPECVRKNLSEISQSTQRIEDKLIDIKEGASDSVEFEDRFIEVLDRKIPFLDVRSRKAIIKYRDSCSDDKRFAKELMNKFACSIISTYPNVGKGSIQQILSFIDSINEEIRDKNNYISPHDIDDRLPLFYEIICSLSVRSHNVLKTMLERANGSLYVLYSIIKDPNFSITKERCAGRKSASEINAIIPNIISLCESPIDLYLLQEKRIKQDRLSKITPKFSEAFSSNADKLSELENNLGYFPLFASVQNYILSLQPRYQTIIKNCVYIYINQKILSRTEVSQIVELSPERIRQIGIKLIHNIASYLRCFAKYTEETKYVNLSFEDINSLENTNFNRNFIFWCLSITCPTFSIIGDFQKSFLRPNNQTEKLLLVSSALCNIFNFDLFIMKVRDEIENEHFQDFEIDIDDLIYQCFINRVYFEHLPEIKLICKKIILEQTDCALVDNHIQIKKNSRYHIPDLIEIILRENGEPMTAQALLEEVNRKEGTSKSLKSIQSGALHNHNIVPIGRSSTYALKEWNEGNSRGGTIREFALEYLLSLAEPIAPVSSIGNYVRQFRPQSRDNSIQYNLLLESSGRFVLYSRGEEKYIGLSSTSFSNDYILVDDEACGRRNFRVSCTLIENFKREKERLPKHNPGNNEEMRLYRFIYVTRSKIEKGLLNEDELAIFKQAVDE